MGMIKSLTTGKANYFCLQMLHLTFLVYGLPRYQYWVELIIFMDGHPYFGYNPDEQFNAQICPKPMGWVHVGLKFKEYSM